MGDFEVWIVTDDEEEFVGDYIMQDDAIFMANQLDTSHTVVVTDTRRKIEVYRA